MATIGHRDNKALRAASTLQEQLDRQIGYLKRSCEMYDQGIEDEAQRIATTLRVLVHDTNNSTSLLTLLQKKNIQFCDTGLYRDRLDAAKEQAFAKSFPDAAAAGYGIAAQHRGEAGLVVAGQNSNGEPAWVAPLDARVLPPAPSAHPALIGYHAFEPWWTTPLVESSTGKYFSRKDLVLIMANQDGGAHVDSGLDQDYDALTKDVLGVWYADGLSREEALALLHADPDSREGLKTLKGNVAAASVRQIAYEVLLSLDAIKSPMPAAGPESSG